MAWLRRVGRKELLYGRAWRSQRKTGARWNEKIDPASGQASERLGVRLRHLPFRLLTGQAGHSCPCRSSPFVAANNSCLEADLASKLMLARLLDTWPVLRTLLCFGLSGLVAVGYNAARRSVRWPAAPEIAAKRTLSADGFLSVKNGITEPIIAQKAAKIL